MNVLLINDHSVLREGVRRLLLSSFDGVEIFEAGSSDEAMSLHRAQNIDVVILDLNLPGVGGLDLLRRLISERANARVLVFSVQTLPVYVTRAMQAGACGYVSKGAGPAELMEAVRQIATGSRYVERELAAEIVSHWFGKDDLCQSLTNRELDILRLLSQGNSLSDISAALSLSYKTVANTCTSLKRKLMVERTGDLIRVAVELHSA